MKKYLLVSTGDLQAAYQKINLALEDQKYEIQAMKTSEQIQLPHIYNIPFFAPVYYKVSTFALGKVYKQYQKAIEATITNPLEPCLRTYKQSMGLPCKHIIEDYLNNSQSLKLDDFNQHWWIYDQQTISEDIQNPLKQKWQDLTEQFQSWPAHQQATVLSQLTNIMNEPIQLQNPQISRTRGYPIGALNNQQSSTKRNPSTFELVDNSNNRRCSNCHQSGHNIRTCPNK